jgi:hypothetical protein
MKRLYFGTDYACIEVIELNDTSASQHLFLESRID